MAEQLETLYAFEIALPYIESKPVHAHTFGEMFFCFGGSGLQMVDGPPIEMSAGDIFYFPPGALHHGNGHPTRGGCMAGVINDSATLFASGNKGDEWAKGYIDAISANPERRLFRIRVSNEGFKKVEELFLKLLIELKARQPGCESLLKAIYVEILAAMARNPGRGESQTDASFARRNSARERIRDVCRFVDVNYAIEMDIDRMAESAGMSRSYFHAKFAELAGRPFLDYLNTRRVEEAGRLLAETGMSPSQIAKSCGFSSLSRFYAEFKKRTGMAPLEYAKAQLAQNA